MSGIYSIYKATNKYNNKSYIGFDSKWPRRYHTHIRSAFDPDHPSYNTIFYKSIRKYGSDAFTWEVIFESCDNNFTLNVMEPRLIQEHKTHYIYGNGYNMTLGGDGRLGCPLSKDERKAHSERMMGNQYSKDFKHSTETKMKVSMSLLGNTRAKGCRGKTWNQNKITCPHCQVVGGSANMKRYHFDKCKKKIRMF